MVKITTMSGPQWNQTQWTHTFQGYATNLNLTSPMFERSGKCNWYTTCLKVASVCEGLLQWESKLSQLQTSTLYVPPTPMIHHMMTCFSAPSCVWVSSLLCGWESLPGQMTMTCMTPKSWQNTTLLSSAMTPSNSSCLATKPTSSLRETLSYYAQVVFPATQWPCSTHISIPTTTSSPCHPLWLRSDGVIPMQSFFMRWFHSFFNKDVGG